MRRIRTANAKDIPTVDALLARAYPRLLKADYAPSIMVTAIPRIARAQPALVACGTYYLCEVGDNLVAAGGWTFDRRWSHIAHIRHVVTDDRFTRQGHGSALINHILRQARVAGATEVVTMSTLTAVSFYASMGFGQPSPEKVDLDAGISLPTMQMRLPLV